jgi:hypothetical protein
MEQILREVQDDEVRLVFAGVEEDGSLLLEERTDGELTVLAYGTLTCVRRLTVPAEHLAAVAWALGPSDASGEGLMSVLRRFFSEEDRYLSDVQDALDVGGVPYSYVVTCGNDLAVRRG